MYNQKSVNSKPLLMPTALLRFSVNRCLSRLAHKEIFNEEHCL